MRSFYLFLTCAAALSLNAGTLSDQDRQQLLDHLNKSRQVFHAALRGVSPAQASFKAGPDRWSILECAEHITQAEQLLLTDAKNGLKMPVDHNGRRPDDKVLEVWGTRKQKPQSSGDYDPTGRWPDLASIEKEFDKRRDATIAFVSETHEDLRAHLCCGPLDSYQQVLGLSAHTLRHVEQINEVKAQPGYPKG